MILLQQQTIYTTTVSLGDTEGESVNQSFYFDKGFILNAVVIRFITISLDVLHDIKFRCEVYPAIGSDFLFDLTGKPVTYSSWYADKDISVGEFTFVMPEVTLDPGAYYFSIVPNGRIPCGASLAIYDHGNFWGNFIKKEFNTGVPRKDTSLMIKIYGSWVNVGIQYLSKEIDSYITTTLRDEET